MACGASRPLTLLGESTPACARVDVHFVNKENIMLGSTVLEVAVGLVFCYATVALIVSTVQEALASALRLRARTLLDAIKCMLNDPHFTGLARALYAHALVNAHDDGQAGNQRALTSKPSYIEPAHFAIALVDAIQAAPGHHRIRGNGERLASDIAALADPQLQRALHSLYVRADGDLLRFEDNVAGWFDSAMERVSGAYKRRSLLVSLLLTLLLAILFNIDSIHLIRALWQHPAVAAQLAAAPMSVDRQTIDALMSLPIGWSTFPPRFNGDFALQVAGWMLTTATGLFGAPFWFSLLQRTMQLRGTGSTPDEKAREKKDVSAPAADGRR
jgi:hypothetical protein